MHRTPAAPPQAASHRIRWPRAAAAVAAAAILFSVAAVAPAWSQDGTSGGAAQADPRFERLKALAGVWVGEAVLGDWKDSTQVTYRVTGAGSALMEVLFEGTPHEMVTIYHLDGPDLVLTHYCAAGNQPHMKAAAGGDPNVLRFDFVRATNLASADAMHMHDAVIRFVDANHLESTWTSYHGGKPAGEAIFRLRRKQ